MEMNRTYFKTLFWRNNSVTYFHEHIMVGYPWDFSLSWYFTVNDFLYSIFITIFCRQQFHYKMEIFKRNVLFSVLLT